MNNRTRNAICRTALEASSMLPPEYREDFLRFVSSEFVGAVCRRLTKTAAATMEAPPAAAQQTAGKREIDAAIEDGMLALKGWFAQLGMENDPVLSGAAMKLMQYLRPHLEKNLIAIEQRLEQVPMMNKNTPQGDVATQQDLEDLPRSQIPYAPPVQIQRQQSADDRIVSLALKLLDVADAYDADGDLDSADRIAELLPKLGLLKTAQYESAQQYWMMNGRAFEKAWREKRKQKPSDDSKYHYDEEGYYRSANDCWWEVLEEYQDALYGNQGAFLKRHASKGKDRKETEEGGMGGGPSTTMSKEMTDFHNKVKEKGMTEGQGWVDWLAQQNKKKKKAADLVLMEKISEQVGQGSSAGVAFYEAMDHCTSGRFASDIMKQADRELAEAAQSDSERIRRAAYQGSPF